MKVTELLNEISDDTVELNPKIEISSDRIKQNVYKKINVKKKRYTWKIVASVAACVCLLLAGNVVADRFISSEKASSFKITAYAQELQVGKEIPLIGDDSALAMWAQLYEDGMFGFSVITGLECTGEGIKSITYSAENAGFAIAVPKGNDMIKSYENYSGDKRILCSSEVEVFDEILCSQYTVDYDHQKDDSVVVNLGGVKKLSDNGLLVGENITLETSAKAQNELINDIIIKCSIEFENGRKEEHRIGLKVKTTSKKEMFGADNFQDEIEDNYIFLELLD